MDIGGEEKLKKEKIIGDESECCCSGNVRNTCCFSNKIFCFFEMIVVLTIGVAAGKYLGEKRGLAPDFCDNNVFINNQ